MNTVKKLNIPEVKGSSLIVFLLVFSLLFSIGYYIMSLKIQELEGENDTLTSSLSKEEKKVSSLKRELKTVREEKEKVEKDLKLANETHSGYVTELEGQLNTIKTNFELYKTEVSKELSSEN